MTDYTPETMRAQVGIRFCNCGFHGFFEAEAHRPDCPYRIIHAHAEAWETDQKRIDKVERQVEALERESNVLLGMVAEEIGFERVVTTENICLFHAWHNMGLNVLSPVEFMDRLAKVSREKPGDERDLRLHYLMVHLPPEHEAFAEWQKALAKLDETRIDLDKTRIEWEKKWHPILCHPLCAWTPENRDIFAQGMSVERLLG